ncbi:Hsp20 family protein [Marinagarivorans cellulosilyticus]|uniref:Molecular chaperone IbpA n=1 Tax=Marinagarivorans cellulosilyticus TaxID=2721545 RepID=A0AAN1WE36_9GAMM|nr:Hsp20 family protein [Marinagarivorans cellulosilyticus]BCD95901.1 molecular chaperone IbpA [Marinagarivorans cellulosilyticus]
MNSIDLTPLYRNSVGFDRLAALLDSTLKSDSVSTGYPPYNIEVLEENHYAITLALAGFAEEDLDIQVEKGVLTVRGKKTANKQATYLHQGIANRSFERKFNLADHIEVKGANLSNGLLTINLLKEVPEAMKPRSIPINHSTSRALENGEVVDAKTEGESISQKEHQAA